MNNPIFTNKILRKMADYGLSESEVLDTFNKGSVEEWTNRKGYNAVRKYYHSTRGVK